MRVGVDATELRSGTPGGVRTALYLLLDALHRHAPEITLEALAPWPVRAPAGVKVVPTGGPERPFFWRRSRALRRAMRGLDLFHSPVTAIPTASGPVLTATVHELPFIEPEFDERPWRTATQWYWLSRAMRECAALFVPSHASFRQVKAAHPAAIRLTHVVPHPSPPAPAAEQRSHDGSLLYVGRLDRRKRLEELLAGAARTTGRIRLAGPYGEAARLRVETAARRLGVKKRLLFLGEVDQETLDGLYRQACAVGLVSISEGFGFPVLEALARGVPVITARGTGAAETGGDAALVVDPAQAEQIAAAFVRAAEPGFRDRIRLIGPARALEFTPARTARGYLEVFSHALDR